ncbi:hypothetical protein GXW78_12330 [Roseomonas terrae]|uniref:Uncharacterized protein n=1 Tax=Neoroseomonas terrae TaxID=424799 RepID=A0ABS5EHF6_9PROT|nr:hypothetical protein [Neoroseomonas terrae]MBR0650454.1 hypothetical protein [Neoroseomonas terrae]
MTTAPRRRRTGGHPFGLSHPVHVRARLRQAEALRLRIAGFTLDEIAAALGYAGRQGVHEALRSARSHASPALRMEEATLDLGRLDRLLAAVLPAAFAGRVGHIEAACRLIEDRHRLIGMLTAIRAEREPQ